MRGFAPGLHFDLPPRVPDGRLVVARSLVVGGQVRERLQDLPVQVFALHHHPLFKSRAVERKAGQELAPVEVNGFGAITGAHDLIA